MREVSSFSVSWVNWVLPFDLACVCQSWVSHGILYLSLAFLYWFFLLDRWEAAWASPSVSWVSRVVERHCLCSCPSLAVHCTHWPSYPLTVIAPATVSPRPAFPMHTCHLLAQTFLPHPPCTTTSTMPLRSFCPALCTPTTSLLTQVRLAHFLFSGYFLLHETGVGVRCIYII